MLRKRALFGLLPIAAAAAIAVLVAGIAGAAPPGPPGPPGPPPGPPPKTATPIKHVVVIFQENVSFDHYFGTYPTSANTDGSTFTARPGTPSVDGLLPATDSSIPVGLQHSTDLTQTNPNNPTTPPTLPNPWLPKRLDSTPDGAPGGAGGQETCDQDHNYSDEQQSFDSGKMDQFVQSVGTDGGSKTPNGAALCQAPTVMDYYDGNSTTALWNYAQHYSMSDNSFGTTFGPSAPGAINLVSGDTGGVDTNAAHQAGSISFAAAAKPNADLTADGTGGFSLTSDAQPFYDDCSTRDAVALTGKNIGDELNAAGLSWGWFQGGFRPTTTFDAAATATGHMGQSTATFIPDEFSGNFTGKFNAPSTTTGLPSGLGTTANQALCNAFHPIGVALGATGTTSATAPWGFKDDYIPHHEPFQYYATTANPHHLTVDDSQLHGTGSLSSIGWDTQRITAGVPQFNTPNHNYDSSDFDALVAAIDSGKLPPSALPAVTFLKAPGYEDGHAQYSNPRDEQAFVVNEINALEKSPDWSSTAIIISYDDSDGWYDHVYSGVTNPSSTVADNLTDTNTKSSGLPPSGKCGTGGTPLGGQQGRCGFGPRLPLMVISPCAAPDYVDHNLSDQASIINFIEYNWNLPSIPGSFDQALKTVDKNEGIPFDMAGMFDFSNCNQPAIQLNPATGEIDMSGAHIHGDNQGSDWANGDLLDATIDGQIQGSFLPGANLTGADLSGVQLQGSDFAHTNLTNADLRGARTNGASFTGATWSNTTCPDGTNSNNDGGTCLGHLTSGGPPGQDGQDGQDDQ
jgi:phospholipase C